MKKSLLAILRLALFSLLLCALVLFAGMHFVKTDLYTALMMKELQSTEDIELALVGSSIVRDHFDAALISEETGLKAFSAGVTSLSLAGSIALTRELYRYHDPEYTVLVLEPYTLNATREYAEAQYKLMPFLSGLQNRLSYYLDVCSEDGDYINRLLMFREFGPDSPQDLLRTVGLHCAPRKTYELLTDSLDPTAHYEGRGFLRYLSEGNADALSRTVIRETTGYMYELLDYSREKLLEYKALCAQKGSKLIILLSSNLTAHALAEPGFLPYGESLMAFCRQEGIPCYNFLYAKPELMENLDGYYFDLYHMNGQGADRFSAAFASFFTRYLAGEDVSGLFYANRWEYVDAISFITNVWIEDGGEIYRADCNRGTYVTPLYRFTARTAEGEELLLRDYSTEDSIPRSQVPQGASLCVYAVPQDHAQTQPVTYDLSVDELIDYDA